MKITFQRLLPSRKSFLVGFMTPALLILAHTTLMSEPSSKVLPLPPADLLALLPTAPKDWNMTVSNAANSVSASSWMVATAIREFTYIPPPPPPGADPNSPEYLPQKAHVMISDTGGSSALAITFAKFVPGTQEGNEKLMIMNIPSIETPGGKDKPEHLIMWANDRFFILIEVTNQRPRAAEKWAKLINFSALASAPATSATFLPNPLIITRVDEMNKENNRSYPVIYNQAREK